MARWRTRDAGRPCGVPRFGRRARRASDARSTSGIRPEAVPGIRAGRWRRIAARHSTSVWTGRTSLRWIPAADRCAEPHTTCVDPAPAAWLNGPPAWVVPGVWVEDSRQAQSGPVLIRQSGAFVCPRSGIPHSDPVAPHARPHPFRSGSPCDSPRNGSFAAYSFAGLLSPHLRYCFCGCHWYHFPMP